MVFDHGWANAYEQHGLNYYPKLVTAIPFTPATGNRFLINRHLQLPELDQANIRRQLLKAAIEFCEKYQLSSWHVLFENKEVIESLESEELLMRCDIQYHWCNQQYITFNDFLATLSSRKRKNLRKERQSVTEGNLKIEQRYGDELSKSEWARVHSLYAGIFLRKHGTATLTEGFFHHIGQTMKRQVMLVLARNNTTIAAAALFFRSDTHLYGRVWGTDDYSDHLHFECCYYQGIEYCIQEKLQVFDSGAQGEHKISRGFLPNYTWSGHWIQHPQFRQSIKEFLQQERNFMSERYADLMLHSPYKKLLS